MVESTNLNYVCKLVVTENGYYGQCINEYHSFWYLPPSCPFFKPCIVNYSISAVAWLIFSNSLTALVESSHGIFSGCVYLIWWRAWQVRYTSQQLKAHCRWQINGEDRSLQYLGFEDVDIDFPSIKANAIVHNPTTWT
jgi:hypothetical protein